MLSISDIRKEQSILALVEGVTTDFLQYQLPTPEPQIYKKLQGRDDIIGALVSYGFLQRYFTDELIPGLLAFVYGSDPERLRQAQGNTDMVLRTLANLFEGSEFKQRQFKFEDILAHAKKTHPFARPEHVRVGLLLVPVLDKFLAGYQWNEQHSAFKEVEVDKRVLAYHSIDITWNAKLKEFLDRDEAAAQAESKRAKAKSDTIETAFDQYQLIKTIGEGAAGWVWQAKDSGGNDVAIKVLNPLRATSEKRKRFQNEILFSSQARHPHIIRVRDSGVMTIEGHSTLFYVMPLLRGSLRKLLPTVTDISQRLKYFDQLLSGVEAAHLQGVVHRDLKPENVLYDAEKDVLVVADFGIAHFTDEELYTAVETKDGDRLANFQYAAPEQRSRGQVTDIRTDIFALGLMLNEFFTGQVPHGTRFKTVASVAPEYAWIDDLVDRMIEQDPQRRLPSIDEVKQQFMARQQDYVTRQRLSQIQNTVISVGEEDDPLAIEPPTVVDFAWENGLLALILSRKVNDGWIHALHNIGNHEAVWNKDPQMFRFVGNRASIAAEASDVQRIIDYFKTWLPRATEVYRRTREKGRHEKAEAERRRLEAEQQELERRRRLRAQIKI
jgi:eukaryotic-like serine/threonine-protein kinase